MHLDDDFDERTEMELLNRYLGNKLPPALQSEIEEIKTKRVVNFEEEIRSLPASQRSVELEHVVRVFKRPSILIKDGRITQTLSEEWKSLLERQMEIISPAISAVGRIELKNHGSMEWNGTGVLISGDRILTNRHVALDFSESDGHGYKFKTDPFTGKFMGARIDFFEEHKNPREFEFKISDVEYIANQNEADIAVLTLDSSPDFEPIQFMYDLEPNQSIVAVGYPWKDSRVTGKLAEIHARIFKDIYNVKRAAPGIVLENRPERFHHDCSVLMGNSGSACIDLETGLTVGIHYAGGGDHNRAVSARKIAELVSV